MGGREGERERKVSERDGEREKERERDGERGRHDNKAIEVKAGGGRGRQACGRRVESG